MSGVIDHDVVNETVEGVSPKNFNQSKDLLSQDQNQIELKDASKVDEVALNH